MNKPELELENFYTCDIRVGCIAVYRGPKVNCIEDAEGRYVFYANGVWDGHKWNVSEADIENAQRVAAELNALCCRAPLPDNKALTCDGCECEEGQSPSRCRRCMRYGDRTDNYRRPPEKGE